MHEPYYVGEKPKPMPVTFTKGGEVDASFPAATLVAKLSIDGAAETNIAMTNNGDGTATINWPTATSAFALADPDKTEGTGSVDVEATDGAYVWFPASFTFPIVSRV
jgi:hypothetical protein